MKKPVEIDDIVNMHDTLGKIAAVAAALVALRAELDVFLKGEFICRKCGLRKDGEIE